MGPVELRGWSVLEGTKSAGLQDLGGVGESILRLLGSGRNWW